MFPDVRIPADRPPRLLVAVAHPDDETFGCGSTILRAVDEGWEVSVVCATRGEAGEVSEGVSPPAEGLGALRESELRAAADLLGVVEVRLLDLVDSGMHGDPPTGALVAVPAERLADMLAAHVAALTPDVVLTLDASDGHRDHAAMRHAAETAARGHGVPCFLQCLPRSLIHRWVREVMGVDPTNAYVGLADLGTPDDDLTVVLDSAPQRERRDLAIAAHASQTSPFAAVSPALRTAFLEHEHLLRAG